MKKYTIIGLVLMVGLVAGIYGVTSIQTANAVSKNLCVGDMFDGKNIKLMSFQKLDAVDSCAQQGWKISGYSAYILAQK